LNKSLLRQEPGRAIFRAIGGIGNQLFVLAAAMAHSKHFGISFGLDTRRSAKGKKQGGPHNLPSQLRTLLLNSVPVTKFQVSHMASFALDTIASVESKILHLATIDRTSSWCHTSQKSGYDEAVFEKRARYFRGYFQSYKYLSYLRETNQDFSLSLVNPSIEFQEISETLAGAEFTVVHLRRGDYLTSAKNFGTLGIDYYVRSLKQLQLTSGIKKIIVFSDDDEIHREKRMQELFSDFDSSFLSTSKLDPAEALLLMSRGSSFVIANSSFSWWAAALSESVDVIYPSVWFRQEQQPLSLAFPKWIASESSWN
jgi:hypothetical protein